MRASIVLFIAFLIAPDIKAQEEESPFSLTGYADVYYAYDFSKPANNSRLFVTQAARHNEFNLNWAYLQAQYDNSKVRGNFAVQTGTYVQYNYAHEPNDLTRMIYLANVGVKMKEGIWVDAGIISPHTGYEGVASLDNEIYTRALGAEYTPYYLTGIKLSAALTEKLDFTAVVVNGWQIISETNNSKSVGLNIAYRPTGRLTLSYGNLFGNEAPSAIAGKKMRSYHNAWLRYDFTGKFHAVASADFGIQELLGSDDKGVFTIWTVIAGYRASEKVLVAVRGEKMTDDNELLANTAGLGFNLSTYSFNFSYLPVENAKFSIEAKYGKNGAAIFLSGDNGSRDNYFLLAGGLAVRFRR